MQLDRYGAGYTARTIQWSWSLPHGTMSCVGFGMRWRVALLVVVAAGLWSARARAMHSPTYDLVSLAFESVAIVRAHRSGDAFVVDATLGGNLRAGTRVQVDTSGYWIRLEPTLVRSAEYVLFLQQRHNHGDSTPDGWKLVPSGLKAIAGGHVYRFEQLDNPGPYESVPETAGPLGLDGVRPALPLPPRAFSSHLSRAIQRARQAHEALEQRPSPARNARLLQLVGPPLCRSDALPAVLGVGLGYENRMATEIVNAFDKEDDLDDALEVFARAHGQVNELFLDPPLSPAALARAAASAKRPMHQRLAALVALAQPGIGLHADAASARVAVKLLGDPDPRIRALACRLGSISDEFAKLWRPALVQRWNVEKDPRVQLELAEAANDLGVLSRLGIQRVHEPIAWARHGRHVLAVEWMDSTWNLRNSTVEWRAHGHRQVSRNLVRSLESGISCGEHVCEVFAPFEFTDELVASGEACAFLEFDKGRAIERRAVPLVGQPAWCQPSRAPAEQQSPIPTPVRAQRPPPGCGCALASDPGQGLARRLVALLGGMLLLLLRPLHRRRRAPDPP